MTTLRELVDAAHAEVYGYAQTVDVTAWLTAPLAADGLSVDVTSTKNFSPGLVQVDDELMIVSSVDPTSSTLSLRYPAARGVRGTTAASHPVGALVTMAPSIPRHQVLAAVHATLLSSSGLFRTDTFQFPMNATKTGYDLPEGVTDILHVSWFPPGPSEEWLSLRQWRHDKHAGQVVLRDRVLPGRTVKVDYSADPLIPASQDAPFTDTGLPDRCADVIRLGAAWRTMSYLEPYNLMPKAAEAEALDRQKVPGSRLRVAQWFFQLYSARLAEEVQELQERHPVRVSFGTW